MSENCLLTDPIVPVVVAGDDWLSLPGVLAALSQGDIAGFPGLAGHQRQSWFQFLVQLAAIALHRNGRTTPPPDPETWTGLLRTLAPETAWSLMVEDLTQPAFLQPPIRQGGTNGYSVIAETPDGIDLPITAKNHDLKSARLGAASPHHWAYALLNLQTMQGFLGAGNYGIARMNGGFASRALIDFVADPPTWGGRFRRAVGLLLDRRDAILAEQPSEHYQPEGGRALLWLEPWDRDESLSLKTLDPYFIEVCRRIRLVRSGDTGALVALGRTSKCARLEAKAATGNLGDPWTAVEKKTGAALTVGAGGFHYRKVVEILFSGKYQMPPTLKVRPDDPDPDMRVHFAVLVRGQGKTDGLYERLLPARHPKAGRHTELYELANGMIRHEIEEGAKRALKAGLCTLLQGGRDDKLDFTDRRADTWLDLLDHRIDEIFFDHLWALALAGDEEAREPLQRHWQTALAAEARAIFEVAVDQLPAPSARRERARAQAETVFYGHLTKKLPLSRSPRNRETMETAP
jgi:CRISPR system Cascade subunit CasA